MGKNNLNKEKSYNRWIFSASERRAMLGFIICALMVIMVRKLNYYRATNNNPVFVDSSIINDFFKPVETDTPSPQKSNTMRSFEKKTTASINANACTKEELVSLGFREHIATTFLKFREAIGGEFKNHDQLLKIYGLNKSEKQLCNQLIIPLNKKQIEQEHSKPNIIEFETPQSIKMTSKPLVIDINTASISDWQSLKGIGPYYAKKIVSFRDALGGFHKIDQIKETYDLPDSIYTSIKPYLVLTDTVPDQISLNNCTYEQLKHHPYINAKQAGIIHRFISERRPIEHTDILKEIIALDSLAVKRIVPYLTL